MARMLTSEERIEARHLLQVLSERARQVRDAMGPAGVVRVTDETWSAQWDALTKELDAFTAGVAAGDMPVGSGLTDRNA